MATRWSMGSTAGQVTPVANGTWDNAASDHFVALMAPNAVCGNTKNIASFTPTIDATTKFYTLVSYPIAAQTITGTVKAQLYGRQSATNDDITRRFELYVVNNAGDTVRGTLLSVADYSTGTELQAAATARNHAWADGDTVSDVAASANDRIVAVIGLSVAATSTTPDTSASIRPANGADLAEGDTAATSGSTWIEFSMTIAMATVTVTVTDVPNCAMAALDATVDPGVAPPVRGISGYMLGTFGHRPHRGRAGRFQ